jgi:hypothetical protein
MRLTRTTKHQRERLPPPGPGRLTVGGVVAGLMARLAARSSTHRRGADRSARTSSAIPTRNAATTADTWSTRTVTVTASVTTGVELSERLGGRTSAYLCPHTHTILVDQLGRLEPRRVRHRHRQRGRRPVARLTGRRATHRTLHVPGSHH